VLYKTLVGTMVGFFRSQQLFTIVFSDNFNIMPTFLAYASQPELL